MTLDYMKARVLMLKDAFLGKGKDDVVVRLGLNRIKASLWIHDTSKKGDSGHKLITHA